MKLRARNARPTFLFPQLGSDIQNYLDLFQFILNDQRPPEVDICCRAYLSEPLDGIVRLRGLREAVQMTMFRKFAQLFRKLR